MYFDTHVHFDLLEADAGVRWCLERALAAGVTRAIAVGGSAAANEFALSTAAGFPGRIFAAVGYDRDSAGKDCDIAGLGRLAAGCARGTGPVAVGEIGMDFHYHPETRGAQRELFARQLEFARDAMLPVIVHSREAEPETLALLGEHSRAWKGHPDRLGVLHCFTGDAAFARRLLDLGLHVSFSGIVTFRNAGGLREAAGMVPAERLLIETDSPLLAPVPLRGRRNEPANLPFVAQAVAEARGCSVGEIAELTSGNAARLFGAGAFSSDDPARS